MARRGSDAPCAFCAVVAGESSAARSIQGSTPIGELPRGTRDTAHVVHSGERTLAFLDAKPVFRGHVLLVPRRHVRTLADLPDDEVGGFVRTAQRLERAVEGAMEAPGSLVLVNNVISQSVPHLHLHVIPRRPRDGLRFFLGPRHPYRDAEDAQSVAESIHAALDE